LIAPDLLQPALSGAAAAAAAAAQHQQLQQALPAHVVSKVAAACRMLGMSAAAMDWTAVCNLTI
jgi:hypothetical protein